MTNGERYNDRSYFFYDSRVAAGNSDNGWWELEYKRQPWTGSICITPISLVADNVGSQAIRHVAPVVWNGLPSEIMDCTFTRSIQAYTEHIAIQSIVLLLIVLLIRIYDSTSLCVDIWCVTNCVLLLLFGFIPYSNEIPTAVPMFSGSGPENMGLAVGISLLSCIQAEIYVISYALVVHKEVRKKAYLNTALITISRRATQFLSPKT